MTVRSSVPLEPEPGETPTKRTRRPYARLSFEDGEVVVTPKDRSIFMISAEKATEACRVATQMEERIEHFESEFLLPVHQWCVAHADKIQACYLPRPMGHIQLFLVTNQKRFDFDLAEEIAAFELCLAKKGWQVGVSQLPAAGEESLATFFSPEGALELYANRGPASSESGE